MTAQGTSHPSGPVVKRVLVGRAMSSARLEHTLLPKVLALPVFSSDALSSVAYATEEIMIVLLAASAAALRIGLHRLPVRHDDDREQRRDGDRDGEHEPLPGRARRQEHDHDLLGRVGHR